MQEIATLRHLVEICSNSHALSQQQLLEMNDVEVGKQDLSQINNSVLAVAGLDVHKAWMKEQTGGVCGVGVNVDRLQFTISTKSANPTDYIY